MALMRLGLSSARRYYPDPSMSVLSRGLAGGIVEACRDMGRAASGAAETDLPAPGSAQPRRGRSRLEERGGSAKELTPPDGPMVKLTLHHTLFAPASARGVRIEEAATGWRR